MQAEFTLNKHLNMSTFRIMFGRSARGVVNVNHIPIGMKRSDGTNIFVEKTHYT